jgi:regulator of cell morphogenesis and NO signaling
VPGEEIARRAGDSRTGIAVVDQGGGLARLIESFQAYHDDYKAIERDLKVVFPLFVEDFIEHIYEEEDTLFDFIRTLERASKGSFVPTHLYQALEKNSVQKFAMGHEKHDDEMEGIRKITKDYTQDAKTPLHVKVLYHELKEFEQSLITHARIENEILFPKAMALENKVKKALQETVKWN